MKRKQFEKLDSSCADVSIDALDIDYDKMRSMQAKEYNKNSEHPTPEQLLIREAIKFLTPKQRKVWEMYNYDRLTQDEIAKKLNIRQQVVSRHVIRIEKRIAKWVGSNLGAYKLLKSDLGEKE